MSLVTIQQAAKWASKHLTQNISESNVSYLVQYGKIRKHDGKGSTLVNVEDLKKYYKSYIGDRELAWKRRLGEDLNWALSFDNLREKERTKHVHRLHPYKGKFIPQLVEYFIDAHVDDFKRKIYFQSGDIILDPFAGSGTTIVQANELGINGIGIDISKFNCLIAGQKMQDYDIEYLKQAIAKVLSAINDFETDNQISQFNEELLERMAEFNCEHFPNPQFKYELNQGIREENEYALKKEAKFQSIYNRLINKYDVRLQQNKTDTFMNKWYIGNVKKEIDFAYSIIKKEKNNKVRGLLTIILSRTMRSCRATTHFDLATLRKPQFSTYYCYKHKKICKPIFSIKKMFNRYATDTVNRIQEFAKARTRSYYAIITGDSRRINVFQEVERTNRDFYELLVKQEIRGIFSSPPYVGQIDYHEQHAYAYDLFNLERKDDLEIGPLSNGQGSEARQSYIKGIADVLINCKQYLSKGFDIFLVANDKYGLYPEIAAKSRMRIANQFRRPVLHRTERDRSPYSETIFHLKNRQ